MLTGADIKQCCDPSVCPCVSFARWLHDMAASIGGGAYRFAARNVFEMPLRRPSSIINPSTVYRDGIMGDPSWVGTVFFTTSVS